MRFEPRASALILYASLCSVHHYHMTKSYALILRSGIIREQCEEGKAEQCFYDLFEQMGSMCSDRVVAFKCHHYKYLDQCFTSSVGICSAKTIGCQARKAYARLHRACSKQNYVGLNKVGRRSLQNPFGRPPKELQFISIIGYLQTQCVDEAQKNCSMLDQHKMLEGCAAEIRSKSGMNVVDFDRHQFLRLRLETSKNLLRYWETTREIECLIVRSTLAELYNIQHRYCFQALTTRCICEQHGFDVSCGINCPAIELAVPSDERFSWNYFRRRLLSSCSTIHKKERTMPIATAIALLMLWFV